MRRLLFCCSLEVQRAINVLKETLGVLLPKPFSWLKPPPPSIVTWVKRSTIKARLHRRFYQSHATWFNFCRALSCNVKIAHLNHLRFSRCDIAEVSNMFENWSNSERDTNCIELRDKNPVSLASRHFPILGRLNWNPIHKILATTTPSLNKTDN